MQVLLVEDDPKLAAFVQKGFFSENINLEIAYDGYIGKRILEQHKFDVVILDVNLPGLNGFQLCGFVKASWPETPVMMLTALGMLQDKISGFQAGADDYLSKPFDFQELLMRTKALARRAGAYSQAKILQISDLVMELDGQIVKRGNRIIDLSKREFDLLEYLLLNKRKIVSRVDILEKVWGLHFDTSTNVIDVYINYLRRKIDKDFEQKLIHTVVGRGYTIREPWQ
ncbi:two-component system copper resistance phosphate regulon response regulator CusR [Dyadobacter sp. BE34]|uniref:Two-component system copper resistance phosphate regulon response regulator CusR n=1 Tax=Dyadobacter fermentans TaxID=94254 RepID=A0ABU1R8B3_9BACT|nr:MULTISPECIES: response regulator transcription factor [Dyadobacter]MDR6809608.1 two-component system copper resistance phosphate regulon response regulator CusR [Dyadobacter fermentans]MDR7047286.1 two-component system copper resistance phosphate regulon response regulator CusR [Dyadobacter sp. BE242]MDR7201522.1 two-component system copper resistance phosphate regulon response regulator CusR [Dyadobacter sp. BE34]MDR7219392.1 two-component system copper resistance phosphate regulon response